MLVILEELNRYVDDTKTIKSLNSGYMGTRRIKILHR